MNYTLIFFNNANTTLALPALSTDTTITVASGTGAIYTPILATQAVLLTLAQATNPSVTEIVLCTAVNGDVLTVIRGQEGTVARAWSQGDYVANLITAGTQSSFAQIYDMNTGMYSPVFNNVSMTTGQVTNAPLNATDITNKTYVDALVASGIIPHALTLGNGLLGGTFNGSVPVTATIDPSVVATLTNTQTLTNKTLSGLNNTFSNIPNSALDYSSLTINGVTGSLGGSITITANTPNSLIAGTGLSGNAFDGGATSTFSITPTGVTAGTYGIQNSVPFLTINAEGQITAISLNPITVSYADVTGLGTIATQNFNNVDITGGTISGVTGTFPTLTVTTLNLPSYIGYLYSTNSGLTASPTIPTSNLSGLISSSQLTTTGVTAGSYTYASFTVNAQGQLTLASSNPTTGTGNIVLSNSPTITGSWGSPDSIQFNVGASVTPTVGKIYWDGGTSLNVGMTTQTVQSIGEDQFIYVKASSAISLGQSVMFTGAVGASGVIQAAPAVGNIRASYIIGVACENIPLNGFGLIQTFGLIQGLNTSAYTQGTVLYYDPTVAGGLTSVEPVAPNTKVQLAAVINSGTGNGSIFVRRQESGSINNVTEFQVTNPLNYNILQYNGLFWANVSSLNGVPVGNTVPSSGSFTNVNLSAGTPTQASLKLTTGSLLTTPSQGSEEFDGNSLYLTGDTTNGSGRQLVEASQLFILSSFGSISSGSAFFGATSRPALLSGHLYEIEYNLMFTATATQTVEFSFTTPAYFTYLNANQTIIQAGYGTISVSNIYANGTQVSTQQPSFNLVSGDTYVVKIVGYVNVNANSRLQLLVTTSTGTITSLAGSYYKVKDLGTSSIGNIG